MVMDLTSKTIVVTGADSGIGRAIAVTCAEMGASVVVAGLQAGGLEQTAALAGNGAMPLKVDITQEDEVEALFERATGQFGAVHGIVANAGISGKKTEFASLSLADFRAVVEVDLVGTFLTLRAAAGLLIEQGRGGSIVVTGSSTAIRPLPGLTPYVAAKAGLHAMVEGLAVELGPHRIRVNTLVPGTTATPLTRAMPGHLEIAAKALPLGEVVEVEELARLTAFALSDAAPHMTGTLLKIDSGRTVS